jgi:hypothetical protein
VAFPVKSRSVAPDGLQVRCVEDSSVVRTAEITLVVPERYLFNDFSLAATDRDQSYDNSGITSVDQSGSYLL